MCVQSPDENCAECEGVITRLYRELRDKGWSDRDAFLSAVRVMELRHPDQHKDFYFLRIARWLGAAAQTPRAGRLS